MQKIQSTLRKIKAEIGEKMAKIYLLEQGLNYLQSNYQCKLGEIDLIMHNKENQIIFVEVKLRSLKPEENWLQPQEAVTFSKQKKIINTALFYLKANNLSENQSLRFDVIAITKTTNNYHIQWIENAI